MSLYTIHIYSFISKLHTQPVAEMRMNYSEVLMHY